MSTLEEDKAFGFLLGELEPEEAESIEALMFEEEERYEELAAFENELVDAYLGGTLDAERRARFEERLLPSSRVQSKIAMARLLVQKAKAPSERSWWARAQAWFTVPRAGMSFVAVAATITFVVLAAQPRGATELTLVPAAVRAESDVRTVRLDGVKTLALELALDDVPARARWQVVVGSQGRTVWRGSSLPADAKNPVAVHVRIPAEVLVAGTYEVRLVGDDGADLATYEMRVAK